MSRVSLLSAAWYGDQEIRLTFPEPWKVSVIGGEEHPALDSRGIQERMDNPIGSVGLRELAAGRKKVAVLVDDITRPTPAALLLPLILQRLTAAGIPESAVRVVIAGGTHAPASKKEIFKKLGSLPSAVQVISHDCRENLVFMGETSGGTPIYVNQAVLECDLKIAVGCIYPHGSAGFSGGSKMIMPGVCGLATVRHAHRSFQTAAYRGDPSSTEFRREIEEVAERVGLDFIVNVVLNQKREIAGLFAGDKKEAYEAGITFATERYKVPIIKNADIVIADAYPFDTFFVFAYNRGLWPVFDAGKNMTTVVLAACPRGMGQHELSTRLAPVKKRFAARLKKLRFRDLLHPLALVRKACRFFRKRTRALMMLSPGMDAEALTPVLPNAQLYSEWEALREDLEARHKKGPVHVAIYRCAPLLIPDEGCGRVALRRDARFPE